MKEMLKTGHIPNENYRLDHFFKGIETMVQFYQHFAGKK